MKIEIPGVEEIDIRHLVFDYNGTLAVNGRLKPGVWEAVVSMSGRVACHVITADTFGIVEKELAGVDCSLAVIPNGKQAEAKAAYVRELGASHVMAAGNGANDRLMLDAACVGIAVLLEEGTAISTLTAADILVKDILDVFGFLETPERLIATLRT